MAYSYEKIKNTLSYAVALNPDGAFPLDARVYFGALGDKDNPAVGTARYAAKNAKPAGSSESAYFYGQQIYVVENDKVTTYLIQTDGSLKEVGSVPSVDGSSIEIKTDANGEKYLTLVGFGDKYIGADEEEHEFEEGLQLTTVSTPDGFKLAWIKPDTTTVEGLSTAVGALGGRMTTAERDIDTLEAKLASMGGIFNFAGAFTSAQFANEKAENYDIGDVVLVDSKDEYLCVEAGRNTVEDYVLSQDAEPVAGKEYYTKDGEDNYTVVTEPLNPTEFQYYEKITTVVVEKRWEQFGDPEGINVLKEEIYGTGEGEEHVNGIKDNLSDLTGQVGALKTAVGKADDNSGLYGYATNVATTKAASALTDAKAYTDEKVEPVATQANANKQAITDLNTSLETKANKTYVDTQLSTKVDKAEYIPRIDELETKVSAKAENSYVNEELAKKANASDVTTATQGLGNRLTQAEQDIDALELAIGQKDAEGKYPVTSLTGRVESIEATDITQNQDIAGLKANLGAFGDNKETTAEGEVYKKTAFAQAAEAKALANDAASLAATKADKTATENALNLKANAADVNKTIGSIPKGEGDKEQSVVEYIDSSIATTSNALTTEINKKANDDAVKTALALKANANDVAAKIGEIGDVSVKTYVDNIADTKVDKETYNADKLEINNKIDLKANQADVTSAIGAINAKIGTLGNVMNFVGELELVEGEIVIKLKEGETEYKTPENGDVGFIDAFEYVFIDGEWVKFGDTSAESGRISALEEKVGSAEGPGLVKDVADLKAADIIINNEINDIKTQNTLFATKAELKAEEDARKEADNTEAAARAAADEAEAKARKDADDAEAATRAQADADLKTYIETLLEWGTFDPQN